MSLPIRLQLLLPAGKLITVGILTEEGDVYVAVFRNPAPASGLETANELLGELMGKQVVVRGRTFDAAGVKVIEISIASEM